MGNPVNTLGTQVNTGETNENSKNTQTTQGSGNTESVTGIGASNYNVSGSSGVSITSTDFGAIQAAQNIATTGLATAQYGIGAVLTGLNNLTGLTGQALLINSKGVQEQNQPVGVTIAKGVGIIVAIVVVGWVLVKAIGAFIGGKK